MAEGFGGKGNYFDLSYIVDKMEEQNILSPITAGISAIAACVATFYAYLTIRKSQNQTYGSLYLQIMDKYASKEMANSLRQLGSLKKDHGDAFADIWAAALEKGDQWAKNVDDARRDIKYFYRTINQLLDSKYISESFAKSLCSPKGALLLIDVVLPLDKKLQIPYEEQEFNKVVKLIEKLHYTNKI